MTLAALVREFALANEMSYEELARLAGVAPNTVRNLVNGHIRKPRNRTIAKIARAIGRDPKEFAHKEVSYVP